MGFNWEEYVELASYLHSLAQDSSGTLTAEAAQRACISRAYFGAFGLMKQWSARWGFNPRHDETDHDRLVRFLNDRGVEGAARRLQDLRRWRNQCDYDDVVPGLQERMKAALQNARLLVGLARTDANEDQAVS